jgi:hypothetical protein
VEVNGTGAFIRMMRPMEVISHFNWEINASPLTRCMQIEQFQLKTSVSSRS